MSPRFIVVLLLTVGNMAKLVGVALVLVGIYFLGQNIFFTSRASVWWYTDIAADACVISMIAGLALLFFGGSDWRNPAYGLIVVSIALVFVSGYVVLQPTSLWEFFISFACIIAGGKLITTGRISI
jgi:hypothetical protein